MCFALCFSESLKETERHLGVSGWPLWYLHVLSMSPTKSLSGCSFPEACGYAKKQPRKQQHCVCRLQHKSKNNLTCVFLNMLYVLSLYPLHCVLRNAPFALRPWVKWLVLWILFVDNKWFVMKVYLGVSWPCQDAEANLGSPKSETKKISFWQVFMGILCISDSGFPAKARKPINPSVFFTFSLPWSWNSSINTSKENISSNKQSKSKQPGPKQNEPQTKSKENSTPYIPPKQILCRPRHHLPEDKAACSRELLFQA